MGRRRRPQRASSRTPFTQILSSTIRVPADQLDAPVESLAISAPLAYALRHPPRVHVLADLQDRTLADVAATRPFRQSLVLELYDLLAEMDGIVAAQRPVIKADFVLSMPASMPPKVVVQAARARGLSISLTYVYAVRVRNGIVPPTQLAAESAVDGRATPRRRSLRSVLEQLIDELIANLLRAVQGASVADVGLRAIRLPTESARLVAPRTAPPIPRRVADRRRVPALGGRAPVEEHPEGLIVDPAGILQALASLGPAPQTRTAPDSVETDSPVPAPLREVPASRASSPELREGEQALRTATGRLVLRRQRRPEPGFRSIPASRGLMS